MAVLLSRKRKRNIIEGAREGIQNELEELVLFNDFLKTIKVSEEEASEFLKVGSEKVGRLVMNEGYITPQAQENLRRYAELRDKLRKIKEDQYS